MKKVTNKNIDKGKSDYKAFVKIMGKTYTSTGVSVLDAIKNLKPQNSKGRAILTIEHDGAKKDRIFMPVLSYRLFNTAGITKDVALKNAASLFQGI